jgi:hypothetical protein
VVLAAFIAGAGCVGVKQTPSAGAGGTGGFLGSSGGTPWVNGSGGSQTDGPARMIQGNVTPEMACVTFTQMAQKSPLDLYIMMDSSGSMDDTTSTGQTKWAAIQGALTSFVDDAGSAGLGVGIQYFPQVVSNVNDTCQSNSDCGNYGPCGVIDTCSNPKSGKVTVCQSNSDCTGQGTCVRLGICGPTNNQVACAYAGAGTTCTNNYQCTPLDGYCNARDKCDVGSYATPAVEVAPLPGVATAITNSFGQHMPDGLTPTSAALSGAITHARMLAAANPTHKVAVLLATDGEPDECTPSDIAGVANIAAGGLSATPSIPTYVIGVFGTSDTADAQTNLNTLASAGGTGQAFIINTSGNVTQSFISALNSVRSSGLACQYMVPAPPADGGKLDYFSVNVVYTPPSGQAMTIGNVKNRASCSPTQGGWYYDVDPSTGATPTTISICDATCSGLKSSAGGEVDILLGCQTIFVIG